MAIKFMKMSTRQGYLTAETIFMKEFSGPNDLHLSLWRLLEVNSLLYGRMLKIRVYCHLAKGSMKLISLMLKT